MRKTTPATRPSSTITTPFALFAFVLDRLAESEPTVRVDAASHRRFRQNLDRIRTLDGDTLSDSEFLNGLHLDEASLGDTDTVPCGRALVNELRTHRQAIWRDAFDGQTTIESLVVTLLQSWMREPDRDPLVRVDFTDERMIIRSRPALTQRFGVRIAVEMDADCLG